MNFYEKIYYGLYQHFERTSVKWWSDVKALYLLLVFEGILILEVNLIIGSLYISFADIGPTMIIICSISLLIFNYWYFNFRKPANELIAQGERLTTSEKRKLRVSLNIWFLLFVIIAGLLGWYLSTVDWNKIQNRGHISTYQIVS